MGDQAGTPSQASPGHMMRPWSQFPCNCLDLSTESPTSQATPQSSNISPGISVQAYQDGWSICQLATHMSCLCFSCLSLQKGLAGVNRKRAHVCEACRAVLGHLKHWCVNG